MLLFHSVEHPTLQLREVEGKSIRCSDHYLSVRTARMGGDETQLHILPHKCLRHRVKFCDNYRIEGTVVEPTAVTAVNPHVFSFRLKHRTSIRKGAVLTAQTAHRTDERCHRFNDAGVVRLISSCVMCDISAHSILSFPMWRAREALTRSLPPSPIASSIRGK